MIIYFLKPIPESGFATTRLNVNYFKFCAKGSK
jgi:hypothetical protein